MYFEDLKLGMTMDTTPVTIEKERMMEFARLYDPIPLHLDEAYAKQTPFGDLIAPGVMSFMSVWARYLEADFFGSELLAGKSTKIEWFKPVFAGDVLRGTVRISRIERRNSHNGIAEVTVEVRNQHDVLVLTDVTESILKYKNVE